MSLLVFPEFCTGETASYNEQTLDSFVNENFVHPCRPVSVTGRYKGFHFEHIFDP